SGLWGMGAWSLGRTEKLVWWSRQVLLGTGGQASQIPTMKKTKQTTFLGDIGGFASDKLDVSSSECHEPHIYHQPSWPIMYACEQLVYLANGSSLIWGYTTCSSHVATGFGHLDH